MDHGPTPGVLEDLRAELGVARAEIARLRAENDSLRGLRSGPEVVAHLAERVPTLFSSADSEQPDLDRRSPVESKLALYRSLFAGRADVYALRWENTRTGKSGWSPATSDRTQRIGTASFLPVDDSVIASHLSGRIMAGVYPLIDGDRCWFLACDFDRAGWTLDALAFVEVSASAGVPAAIERSQSGNGAHVWIFFDQPVAASVARRLGTGLLRETMTLRAEVDLASYDRLFPSQDFIPQRGFGNLIALPLQGQRRKHANSVFVDPSSLEPWDDQWAFLASVRRLSAADANSIGDAIRVDTGPGTSHTRPAGRLGRTGPPAPPTVAATFGSTLAIERIGLPPALTASLKHLASVHNPEFHKREQLRLSTWNTPRMVRCYEEDLDRLYLPRGIADEAARIVASAGSRLVVDDRRPQAPSFDFEFRGVLTAGQDAAVADLVGTDLGVLVAPTGAGKTVMACALIARLATPTLVLVHTRPLAEQWHQRLGDLLGLAKRQIGQLGGGRSRTTGIVDLVTLQTLTRREDPAQVFAGYGLVIVDECHHLPAVTFGRSVQKAPNRRWVGLTATPRRSDGLEAILHMQLGPVRHVMAVDAQNTVMIRRDLVVHETLTDPDTDEGTDVQTVLGRVAESAERTDQIAADIADACRRARNVLVFTDRTDHLEQLRSVVADRHGLQPLVLKGGLPTRQRAAIVEALQATKGPILLLATGAYLGEGFDLPALDTLFLTFPISGRTRVVQYVGRVTRSHPTKTSIEIHDYHDTLHPLLRRMHQRRLVTLKTLGFTR